MTVYLTIITTLLVVTQIIRVSQNHIQLRRQRKEIDKTLDWFRDNDVSETDFQTQRAVYYMLYEKLMKERDNENN